MTDRVPESCAVVECWEPGLPQVCLYDGRYHHHGCIHYETAANAKGSIRTELVFRDDGWFWLCSKHYGQLKSEYEAVYPIPHWQRREVR